MISTRIIFSSLTAIILTFSSCHMYMGGTNTSQQRPKPQTTEQPTQTSSGSSGSSSSSGSAEIYDGNYQTPDLNLNWTQSPFPTNINGVKHAADITYANYARNAFDVWLAKSDEPTPMVIFIHGGGFKSGDKAIVYNKGSQGRPITPQVIRTFLENGISFASLNYRLLGQNEKDGVIKSLNDSKRAIQFIKYHADKLNIDPDRIALTGSSAGAGTCLWIGLQDDMADPNSPDPIKRMSTKVQAIAVNETQSTYDLGRWFGEVFPVEGFTIDKIRGTALEKKLLPFYGISSMDEFDTPRIQQYRDAVDMLDMMSSDDPPVWIRNGEQFKEKNGRPGNILHSPYHAMALKKELDKAGVKSTVYVPAADIASGQDITMVDFLISNLN